MTQLQYGVSYTKKNFFITVVLQNGLLHRLKKIFSGGPLRKLECNYENRIVKKDTTLVDSRRLLFWLTAKSVSSPSIGRHWDLCHPRELARYDGNGYTIKEAMSIHTVQNYLIPCAWTCEN